MARCPACVMVASQGLLRREARYKGRPAISSSDNTGDPHLITVSDHDVGRDHATPIAHNLYPENHSSIRGLMGALTHLFFDLGDTLLDLRGLVPEMETHLSSRFPALRPHARKL